MNVTTIADYHASTIQEMLDDLTERNRRGQLRGVAIAFKTSPGRHRVGLAGDYARDPFQVLGVSSRLNYKANQLISAGSGEPETRTMPL